MLTACGITLRAQTDLKRQAVRVLTAHGTTLKSTDQSKKVG